MKLEIYNSVHTSESVPSRVNVWGGKERHTDTQREREWGEKKDLISYAWADHTARGVVKSPEQNKTLNNEPYVHHNILLFHFDTHMKKGKWGAKRENLKAAPNNKQE